MPTIEINKYNWGMAIRRAFKPCAILVTIGTSLALTACTAPAPQPAAPAAPVTQASTSPALGDDGAGQPAEQPAETATSEAGSTPAGETCGLNKEDPRISAAAADLPSPFVSGSNVDVKWDANSYETNFDPCAPLSYALFSVEGATGSSPDQIALFHYGEHIGSTSDCAPGMQRIAEETATSIKVKYFWPAPNESMAEASQHETVEYRWNDATQSVDMIGTIPDEVIGPDICHTWPPIQ